MPAEYIKRYGRMRFTDRDYRILEIIYLHRHVSFEHIDLLINPEGGSGTRRQLYDRMKGMFHLLYVARYRPRAPMYFVPGGEKPIYGLAKKGASELCAWMSARDGELYTMPQRGKTRDSDISWSEEHYRRSEDHLLHELVVTDTMVALELAVRADSSYGIEDRFLSGQWSVTLEDLGKPQFQKGGGLRAQKQVLEPDAYVLLNEVDQRRSNPSSGLVFSRRNLFFEIDRATMEVSTRARGRGIAYKMHKYVQYLESADFEQTFPDHGRVFVCFVIASRPRQVYDEEADDLNLRLENIKDQLKGMYKGSSKNQRTRRHGFFRFTTVDRFSLGHPEAILTKPIWESVTMPGKRLSLATPAD